MFKQEQRQAIPGIFENVQQPKNKTDDERMAQMGYEDYGDYEENYSEEDQQDIAEDISIRTVTVKKLPVTKIVFYSLQGEKIYEGSPTSSTYHLLNDVKSGTYIVAMYASDGTMSTDSIVHIDSGYEHNSKNTTKIFFQTEAEVEAMKPKPAQSIDELIDLVKQAEIILKFKGQDLIQRIRTLRGMFYGTDWGYDFVKAEQSHMRNIGFSYFIYGTDAFEMSGSLNPFSDKGTPALKTKDKYMPTNPSIIFGADLFNAIFNSFEVRTPNGKITDFGHLMIGLEARFNEHGRTETAKDPRGYFSGSLNPTLGGTGAEVVTWLGDLGGGAFKLASERVKNASASVSIIFPESGSSYGAAVNLEGDIASFIIAAGDISSDSKEIPTVSNFTESGGIAEMLKNYFGDVNKEWTNRAKIFLTIYGGKFDKQNNLINRDKLINAFADKIAVFAETYGETRKKDELNNKRKTVNLSKEEEAKLEKELEQIDGHYKKASTDIATQFVIALEKTLKDPARHVSP